MGGKVFMSGVEVFLIVWLTLVFVVFLAIISLVVYFNLKYLQNLKDLKTLLKSMGDDGAD